jgi:hypothetical protein
VITKGEKVGKLYLCIGNIYSSISLASTRVDTTLWHHRLGHMSKKGRNFTKGICFQILNKLIWISVSIVFMEKKRES